MWSRQHTTSICLRLLVSRSLYLSPFHPTLRHYTSRIPPLLIEWISVTLVVYKAIRYFQMGAPMSWAGSRFMDSIVRYSVLYFIMSVFWCTPLPRLMSDAWCLTRIYIAASSAFILPISTYGQHNRYVTKLKKNSNLRMSVYHNTNTHIKKNLTDLRIRTIHPAHIRITKRSREQNAPLDAGCLLRRQRSAPRKRKYWNEGCEPREGGDDWDA